MGAEGGNSSIHPRPWSLWNEGMVMLRDDGSPDFTPIAGGAADWGLLYALISFNDTKNDRRVLWGWAPEEIADFAIKPQGFQGCMGLPREVFIKESKDVVNENETLAQPGNSRLVDDGNGTFAAYTLGVRPLADVVAGIRNGSEPKEIAGGHFSCSQIVGHGSSHMEVVTTFSKFSGPAGLTVAASPGGEEYTTISFDPASSTISVDRTHSSTIAEMTNYTVIGYFRPYKFAGSGKESITMNVFLDGSLLEVFVNVRASS